MSDRIYSDDAEQSTENIVLVAQACKGVLTKRHYSAGVTKSYDRVKRFNFFENNLWSLDELFNLSKRLLDKPRCCIIRSRLRDRTKRWNVLRRSNDSDDGEPATLIPYRCNWFALDIDGFGRSTGNLKDDFYQVLRALPSGFAGVECFVVASASYGIKPGIHMRMFYWSQNVVSLKDLHRFIRGNKACIDLALFENPVQPIYTAKPIFESGMIDPVKQRIQWIDGDYSSVNVKSEYVHAKGMEEITYTKQQADAQAAKYLSNISRLAPGERHPGLIKWCYPLGKLIGQDHFDRDEMIERILNHCSFWGGKRDTKRDTETITYAVDRGIDSMFKGEQP